MLKHLVSIASLLLLAATPGAQEECSSLSIDREGHRDQIDILTVGVTDAAPGSPTWVAIGLMDGPLVLEYGAHLRLELGVSHLIATPYLGQTNERGLVERSFEMPSAVKLTAYGQAIGLERSDTTARPRFAFCNSGVVRFKL